MNKHTPTIGDIYLDDDNYVIVICHIDGNGEYYVMYEDGSCDTLYNITNEFTYIGHYDINQVFKAMVDAKEQYMDIDKQVVAAVQYMNKHVCNKDGATHLVGCDMRVDKEIDTVFVQMYNTIGAGYRWISVADLMKEYTIK